MTSQPNGKTESPAQEKDERGRSSIEFTYNGLDDCEELVSVVRAVGGHWL